MNSNFFHKRITNISSETQNFQNQLQYTKFIGYTNALGFELFLQKKLNKILTWMSYSFTNNFYKFDEYSPQNITSNLSPKHHLKCAALYDYKNINFAIGADWHTGKPSTKPLFQESKNTDDIIYEFPNSSTLSNFFQLNLSASYTKKWEHNKINFGISIQNITSKKNIVEEYYRKDNDKNTQKISIYGINLLPNLFIRYYF